MSDVVFIDPIASTNTFEWQCQRCGDYIVSRSKPKCANCDADEKARRDIVARPHEPRLGERR